MDKSLYVLGGTAWINLVNTSYISNKQRVDLLEDPSSTFQWLEENNLLRESDAADFKNKELLDSLIAELHSLRDLSKLILSDLEQQEKISPNTTAQFKKLVEQIKVGLTIDPGLEKPKLTPDGLTARDQVLYKIVDSIVHTLGGIAINRIRKCEHQECSLHFVDTSKSGRRRWCSMELCGNRKKAAEFYARKKNRQ